MNSLNTVAHRLTLSAILPNRPLSSSLAALNLNSHSCSSSSSSSSLARASVTFTDLGELGNEWKSDGRRVC
jgi:hypothetical protein